MCSNIFLDLGSESISNPSRASLIDYPKFYRSPKYWLGLLNKTGHLVYSTVANTGPSEAAFLASNEGDWDNTPFDAKPTDLLIAFGTNSAWEIAADKSAKKMLIADWSPLPILAHAFLVSPLLRVSANAQEFIQLLSGEVPSSSMHIPVSRLLLHFSVGFGLNPHKVQELLAYLSAKPEITNDELKFLAQYFWSRTGFDSQNLSPFRGVRDQRFEYIPGFLQIRYANVDPAILRIHSVLHNAEKFQWMKNLYLSGGVDFAVTEVADENFYRTVQILNPSAKDISFSATNIFDMDYNGHSNESFRNCLSMLLKVFDISPAGKKLTVFQTRNWRPPHQFLRYDIHSASDIPTNSAIGMWENEKHWFPARPASGQ